MERFVLRLALILLLGSLLLVGSGALAQPAPAAPPPVYRVDRGTLMAEHYRLSTLSWEVGCPSAGGGYVLRGPVRPNQGAGCCCTYLPISPKGWRR